MALSRWDCATLTCAAIVAIAGCSEHESETNPNEDAGTGTDTSSDSDTDTDTDTSTSYTAIDVSGAFRHTCAVLVDGAIKCWGFPLFGWLGYGYDAEGGDSSLPSTLPFVDVGGSVEQISAGGGTCALLEGGAVKCWGSVALGIPEVDAIGDDDVPADFPSLDLGGTVVQVSSGGGHVCALLQGGDVKCWGENEWGQLGNADDWHIIDASTVLPIDLGGPAIDVSAGSAHTCTVLENGDVLCWGNPGSGKLGYGNTEIVGDDEVPADVGPIDLGGPAVQVSAGGSHTCAVLEGGAVLCWGYGEHGQLGYGNTESIGDDEVPADVGPVEVGGPVEQVACGGRFTCVLLMSGEVKCWGDGAAGRLGYGNTEDIGDDEVPADVGVLDIGEPVEMVQTGWMHACAVTEDGLVVCWGNDFNDVLGYGEDSGNIGDDEVPADVGPVQII